MKIIRTVAELREEVRNWRRDGRIVGVVPTMGALHDGHLSLVSRALAETDRVIVTLFVNPKQFNEASDLDAYPRTEESDAEKLKPLGAHVLYAPNAAEMYPSGFQTKVSVAGVSEGLCGAGRPGHFDGVATVVSKLFLQAGADKAFFGEKDFQQLHVVRRMARDLDIPIEVVGCPTVREADGLALSSRNERLSAADRANASAIAAALLEAADRLAAGVDIADTLAAATARLKSILGARFEYLELRHEDDLSPVTTLDRQARLLTALWLGDVRLIDNVSVATP